MAEARKLGFKPDGMASSLRTGKGQGATLIVSQKGPEVMLRRNHLLFESAKKAFKTVKVVTVSRNDELNDEIWNSIAERTRALFVTFKAGEILPELKRLLFQKNIPLTSIDAYYDGFDSVQIDRAPGTYQAARMLLLCGCKNPVFFSSSTLDAPDARLEGIIKAFQSLSRPPAEIKLAWSSESGSESLKGFHLAEKVINTQPVDGLFCYNDLMAIGALRALYRAGVKVPEEVRVIGFDNIPVGEFLPVSLATVAQPGLEPVDAAMNLTLDKIENFAREPRCITFPSHLIARETCPIEDYSLREKIFAKAEF